MYFAVQRLAAVHLSFTIELFVRTESSILCLRRCLGQPSSRAFVYESLLKILRLRV